MRWVTTAILPLSDPGAAASRSSYVRNSAISASMPLASVATEPPNAVTARCCGTEPTISALSAPRIQAGKLNGSECTFSKPAAFNLVSAHTTARLWASVPARRCPISVVSASTKSKAAGSLSAFCPRLDAVTAKDSVGGASVALIVAPALAARATATTRMRKILPIQIAPSPIHQGLIPTALIGDLCPWPCSNGGHLFDIVDEGVPGGAASLNDLLIRVPDDVTEIVGTQIFPDILDRVQFRGVGWQTE